jgi:hypothetical protein
VHSSTTPSQVRQKLLKKEKTKKKKKMKKMKKKKKKKANDQPVSSDSWWRRLSVRIRVVQCYPSHHSCFQTHPGSPVTGGVRGAGGAVGGGGGRFSVVVIAL